MSKSFQQYIADAIEDIQSEDVPYDFGVFMDIAESMLCDAVFRELAEQEFPNAGNALQACVADCLCF